MSVIEEIVDVINVYKSHGKDIAYIAISREAVNEFEKESGQKPEEIEGNTFMGYPLKFFNGEYHQFTVQSKTVFKGETNENSDNE